MTGGVVSIYKLIVELSSLFSISLILNVLCIGKSSFYAWQRSLKTVPVPQDTSLEIAVKEIFLTHRRRYGARRIVAELSERGVPVSRRTVRQLMKLQGLVAIQPKSFVPKTTDSRGTLERSPNLLLNEDDTYKVVSHPFEVLMSDITYLKIRDGSFLYLATFQDAYTRVIVGWELLDTLRSVLIINALKKGIDRKSFPKGMIIHSDGGSQYGSEVFKKLLGKYEFRSSMTRKDNHYDNAMGESLFSRFKAEVLEKGVFENFEDAYTEVFEYIEVYYNKKRRHSGIHYDFPERFEKKELDKLKL